MMPRVAALALLLLCASVAGAEGERSVDEWSRHLRLLPRDAVGAAFFRGPGSPLTTWTRRIAEAPSCVPAQLARVTGFTYVYYGWRDPMSVVSGRFERKALEKCFVQAAARSGEKVVLTHDHAITVVRSRNHKTLFYLAFFRDGVAFGAQRRHVESMLGRRHGLPQSSALWSLAAHLGDDDEVAGVIGLDATARLLGVPSSGLIFRGALPPAVEDGSLTIGLAFRSRMDAMRAMARIAGAPFDEEMDPTVRQFLATLRPTVEADVLWLELGSAATDPDVVGALEKAIQP